MALSEYAGHCHDDVRTRSYRPATATLASSCGCSAPGDYLKNNNRKKVNKEQTGGLYIIWSGTVNVEKKCILELVVPETVYKYSS